MSFFTRKKRCPFCASILKDNKCPNDKCINYDPTNQNTNTQKEQK